eukprot:363758-Chlamydomonas_euryale.AAC.2
MGEGLWHGACVSAGADAACTRGVSCVCWGVRGVLIQSFCLVLPGYLVGHKAEACTTPQAVPFLCKRVRHCYAFS